MARPTIDPSFGGGFDAAAFRSALRNAMTMGLPNTVSEQATFRWTTRRTYNPQDPIHDPYGWTQAPVTTTSHADVIVPVAVELQTRAAGSIESVVGEFDTTWATITVLDTDMALISGADEVVLGLNTYEIIFIAPPMGLFEVTVYQLHARARDES